MREVGAWKGSLAIRARVRLRVCACVLFCFALLCISLFFTSISGEFCRVSEGFLSSGFPFFLSFFHLLYFRERHTQAKSAWHSAHLTVTEPHEVIVKINRLINGWTAGWVDMWIDEQINK